MHKRIIVLLKIEEEYYKFLSILFSQKDASYFVYNHLINEAAPLLVAEPFHLLKTSGNFKTDSLQKRQSDNGQQTHLSFHPTRIYLKKRGIDGKEEHLIDEYEPQPFNKEGFRLNALFTPAAKEFLPRYNLKTKNSEELIVFEWENELCPQISLYEFSSKIDMDKAVNILPDNITIQVIQSDGVHPTIALHLRTTNGNPGVWASNLGIFGKIIKKKPISKADLQKIIDYNGVKFDISSLPDNAIITDYKVEE